MANSDWSTLPLILSASKYFRQISPSFYICRGQNEHFSTNSVRKKGRVELFQIFHPSKWCTDIYGHKKMVLPVPNIAQKAHFGILYFLPFLGQFHISTDQIKNHWRDWSNMQLKVWKYVSWTPHIQRQLVISCQVTKNSYYKLSDTLLQMMHECR